MWKITGKILKDHGKDFDRSRADLGRSRENAQIAPAWRKLSFEESPRGFRSEEG